MIQSNGCCCRLICGTSAGARNIISGNTENTAITFTGNGSGVFLGFGIVGDSVFPASDATGNVIQGNYIGTNAPGTAALGNRLSGVSVIQAPTNTIGGTIAAARNVISANEAFGVLVSGANNNSILGVCRNNNR